MKEEILKEYAELIVKVGVNLRQGQTLVINAPIECAAFARLVAASAFDAGAHDVSISWSDERMARLRYEKGALPLFSEFPEWRVRYYEDYAKEGAAFVSIHAADPEIFAGIAEEKLTLAQQAAGAALMEYRARLMNNENAWCVVSVPSAAWAKKVFPALPEEEAKDRLMEAILAASRVEEGRTVANWREHIAFLQKAAEFMNKCDFKLLHYTNSLGTDLTVELPEGHIWAGGAEMSASGTEFAANIPTEEVYTAPRREGVNGVVYAAKPLIYSGKRIEGFSLTFKEGRVVDFHAKVGEETLKELISMDEGSHYLGEVALVPFDSPISKSGILFYNTLFDENAACHLALGKAYPTCLKGGEKMGSVELLQHGINDSLVHEDFMIGTSDLNIVGETRGGRCVQVFKDGNFAF